MRALLFTLPVLLLSCGDPPAAPGPLTVDQARRLGRVAKEIRVQPELAEAARAGTGFTPALFEAALYGIASDPALSEAYADAL